jgi:hypothetical protein
VKAHEILAEGFRGNHSPEGLFEKDYPLCRRLPRGRTSSSSGRGLLPRDIIVSIAEIPMSGVDDLHRFLDENPVGRSYEMTVLRNGTVNRLDVRSDEAAS